MSEHAKELDIVQRLCGQGTCYVCGEHQHGQPHLGCISRYDLNRDFQAFRAAQGEALTQAQAVAAAGSNWPCMACGYGHSAVIDKGFVTELEQRAEKAEAANIVLQAEAEVGQQVRELVQAISRDGETVVGAVQRLIAEVDALAGCDGNCSCAVWKSRHEAAMALYRTMSEQAGLRTALEQANAIIGGVLDVLDKHTRGSSKLANTPENLPTIIDRCFTADRRTLEASRELAQTDLREQRKFYEADQAGLRAQVQAFQWQPIETAPEATYVLVRVPNYGINIATMTRDPNILGPNGAYWFIRGDNDPCKPTHWMPIPAFDALLSSVSLPQLQEKKDDLARVDTTGNL